MPLSEAQLRASRNYYKTHKDKYKQFHQKFVEFVESYEITNNIEDYISSSYIKTWLDIHFKGTSVEKFTKQLKSYCCKKFGENCLVDNKYKKINGNTVRIWYGIKEIDCDDDEITECNY